MTTASAAPFGDDWNRSIRAMQEALGNPGWQRVIKQMQAAQAPALSESMKQMQAAQTKAFREAVQPIDFAAMKPLAGVDFSGISKAVTASQNAEVQAAIKRLTTGSSAQRWVEIARQISVPMIPKIEFAAQQAIAALQLELEAVRAPEFGPDYGEDVAAPPAGQPGFDWIKLIPRKAQIRLLILVLTVIASLTQGTASVTHNDLPPGLAEFEAAALVLAGALNEAVGPVDDDEADED
jgi:hypothetical protein